MVARSSTIDARARAQSQARAQSRLERAHLTQKVSMLDLVPNHLRRLEAYHAPAEAPSGTIRLDGNESPYALSPRTWIAVNRLAECWPSVRDSQRYPVYGQRQQEFVARLETFCFGAEATSARRQSILGVGSDDLIALLLTMISGHKRACVLVPTPTFSMYKIAALARNVRCVEVPLTAGKQANANSTWMLDVDAMRHATEKHKPKIVFLASPNNPTGNAFSEQAIAAVIKTAAQHGTLVVLDEAYAFYQQGGSRFVKYGRHANVAVMSTLSKVGFASCRIGVLNLEADLAAALEKIRLPYNMPAQPLALADAALQLGHQELKGNIERVLHGRDELLRLLTRAGFQAAGSDANFLCARVPQECTGGEEVASGLRKLGVWIRAFTTPVLRDHVRISVGTAAEHRQLENALKTLQTQRPNTAGFLPAKRRGSHE